MRKALAMGLLGVVIASGCGETPISPTVISPRTSSRVLTGRLEKGGFLLLLFQVLDAPAPVRITLASVTTNNQTQAIFPVLNVQAGAPHENGCGTVTEQVNTAPALTAQLPLYFADGTYCVQVTDIGTLTEDVDVAVRVTVAPLANDDSSATETFSSNVSAGGAAARSFLAKQPGDVSVTLTSLGAPMAALGIGVDAEAGCQLNRIVRIAPGGGPHLTVPVDQGFYCVKLFDVDSTKNETPFSLSITHP